MSIVFFTSCKFTSWLFQMVLVSIHSLRMFVHEFMAFTRGETSQNSELETVYRFSIYCSKYLRKKHILTLNSISENSKFKLESSYWLIFYIKFEFLILFDNIITWPSQLELLRTRNLLTCSTSSFTKGFSLLQKKKLFPLLTETSTISRFRVSVSPSLQSTKFGNNSNSSCGNSSCGNNSSNSSRWWERQQQLQPVKSFFFLEVTCPNVYLSVGSIGSLLC